MTLPSRIFQVGNRKRCTGKEAFGIDPLCTKTPLQGFFIVHPFTRIVRDVGM